MVRLLCVEDDPLMRVYLTTRLGLEPDVRVVGAVGTAGDALGFVRRQDVDVILLDYRLAGADGLQLLGALGDQFPQQVGDGPRVLFCTGLADAEFELEARAHGAAGVVAKELISRELLPAIRAVAGGENWFRYTSTPS